MMQIFYLKRKKDEKQKYKSLWWFLLICGARKGKKSRFVKTQEVNLNFQGIMRHTVVLNLMVLWKLKSMRNMNKFNQVSFSYSACGPFSKRKNEQKI